MALGGVGVVLLTTGPLFQLEERVSPAPGIDERVTTTLLATVFALALAALGRRPGWWRVRGLWPAGACAALVLVSTVWSVDRATTLSTALMFAGTCVFGAFLASLGIDGLLASVWAGAQLGVFASAWARLRDWSGSVDRFGNVTGIYYNRNSLAPVCGFALIAGVAVLARRVHRRDPATIALAAVVAVGAALDLWLLRSTRSASTLLGIGAAAVVLAVLEVARRRATARPQRWAIAVGGIAVGLAAVAVAARSVTARWVGRDVTLNGRTEIWHIALDWVRERPLQGFGWMAVWARQDRQDRIIAALGEPMPFAHNALIEGALGAGVLGVLAVAGTLAVAWYAPAAAAAGRGARGPVALAVLSILLCSLDGFFDANRLPLAVLVAVAAVYSRPTTAAQIDVNQPQPSTTASADELV